MTTILLGKECSPFLEIDDSLLQRAAVRLVWAESTDAFGSLAHEHRPDLVVLDPQVAGFDANACADALRADLSLTGTVILLIGNRSAKRSTGSGAVNGTAPNPVRNADLSRELGKTLHPDVTKSVPALANAPAASSAITSACGPPAGSLTPSPATEPSAATMTAPTVGFGYPRPARAAASSSARSRLIPAPPPAKPASPPLPRYRSGEAAAFAP